MSDCSRKSAKVGEKEGIHFLFLRRSGTMARPSMAAGPQMLVPFLLLELLVVVAEVVVVVVVVVELEVVVCIFWRVTLLVVSSPGLMVTVIVASL